MASTKMEEDFPRYFGLLLRFLQSKTLQFSVPTSHVTNQETSATQTIIKYRQSEQLMLLCTQIVDQYYVETFLLAFRRVQYEFANLDISKLSISAQKYTIQTHVVPTLCHSVETNLLPTVLYNMPIAYACLPALLKLLFDYCSKTICYCQNVNFDVSLFRA